GRLGLRRGGEELGDVEADAAGADDGNSAARRARAVEDGGVAGALGVIDAGNVRQTRAHSGGNNDGVVAARGQLACARPLPEPQIDAEAADAGAPVGQRGVELLLTRHVAREVELPADPPLR